MINKIVLAILSTDHNNVATKHYSDMISLSKLFEIKFINKIDEYLLKSFSFIVIPPYKEDYKFLKFLRTKKIRLIFLDPRSSKQFKQIRKEDIVIIDSIEQYDFATKVTKNIFTYYEFPIFKKWNWETDKKENSSDLTNIYYHGNKVHLLSSKSTMIKAIKKISDKYNINFNVCYNIRELGKIDFGIPNITYHQWDKNIHYDLSKKMHIGLCPAFIPINFRKISYLLNHQKKLLTNKDDYFHRFKLPSNPGRIITLIMMGLPVISDMFPSACQVIDHGDNGNGYLVSSYEGWFNAISSYIENPSLRLKHSKKLINIFESKFAYKTQNDNLFFFLKLFL